MAQVFATDDCLNQIVEEIAKFTACAVSSTLSHPAAVDLIKQLCSLQRARDVSLK